ncbi:MAG: DUF3502 domain-containing protein [Clostridiales bacterium]|jgi:putative aldouronate transport system substrate-binding protein|nr:DUF3502 domain-containing protein [Clostridiales bacterium]
MKKESMNGKREQKLRLVCLILAACLMLAALAACGSGAQNTGTATTEAAATTAAAAATTAAAATEAATTAAATTAPAETTAAAASGGGAAANGERVDLVFYVMGDPPKDEKVVEDAVNAKLLEKLNATVDFQFSTWTDYQQKYANELTSGSADLIYIANWLNYGLMANAGAFLELDDLLTEYAPELKAIADEGMLNMCRVGGELYAIPNLWPEYVPIGIDYREDLRVKYNLPRPDSIENAEAYFLGIKQNEPDQPILRVTTEESQGLSQAFDAASILNIKYPWSMTNGLPYGLSSDYSTPTQISDYWNSQDFIDDCKLLKRWADYGFWSKSALSDTNDVDSYKNGLCVALVAGQNPNKHITNIKDFSELHPDWKSEYIAYGEITGSIYPGHATQNGTSIVRASKHPERAMQVLNYFMTDEEMNRLVQAGIEGTHYSLTDGIYKNLSSENPAPFPYEGFNSWNLRVTEFKLIQESDLVLNEMFKVYDELAQKTKFPNVNIAGGFSENYEDFQAERTAVTNIMRQYLAPLQAGLVDDVDAAVAEFLRQVNAAGLETCREHFKEQWIAYCTEYGYQ